MLDGINVLQEHFCRELSLASCIFVSVLTISLATFYIIYSVCVSKNLNGTRSFNTFLVVARIIVICVAIACVIASCCSYLNTWQEYSVTIDDSVKFNEFFDKYEIISQNGYIFRIKEIGS